MEPAEYSYRWTIRPALLIQVLALVWIWSVILLDDHFGRSAIFLLLVSLIVSAVSHAAYHYLFRHRLTPLIVSHALCLGWFSWQGGLFSFQGTFSEKLWALQMIASGPFAWGVSGWSFLLSPVLLSMTVATIAGVSFQPSFLGTYLISSAATFWYGIGLVLMVFASLGT